MTCSAATLSAASTIAASTRTPSPVRRRCSSASSSALRRVDAGVRVADAVGSTGFWSGWPVSQVSPEASSITKANAGLSRHGPSSPKPGMRTMIASGRSRVHGVEVEPDLVEHPRRVVLDDDVAGRDELVEQLDATLVAEVERHALLVGVQAGEDRRPLPPVVFGERHAGEQAGAVGACRRLDVDHLGAEHAPARACTTGRPRTPSCRGPADPRTAASGTAVGRDRLRARCRFGGTSSVCSPSRGAGCGERTSDGVPR